MNPLETANRVWDEFADDGGGSPLELMQRVRAAFAPAPPAPTPEAETCRCGKWRKGYRCWELVENNGSTAYVSHEDRQAVAGNTVTHCATCNFCLTDPSRNAQAEPVAWVAWDDTGRAHMHRVRPSWYEGEGEDKHLQWWGDDDLEYTFIHICWLDGKGRLEEQPRPLFFAPPAPSPSPQDSPQRLYTQAELDAAVAKARREGRAEGARQVHMQEPPWAEMRELVHQLRKTAAREWPQIKPSFEAVVSALEKEGDRFRAQPAVPEQAVSPSGLCAACGYWHSPIHGCPRTVSVSSSAALDAPAPETSGEGLEKVEAVVEAALAWRKHAGYDASMWTNLPLVRNEVEAIDALPSDWRTLLHSARREEGPVVVSVQPRRVRMDRGGDNFTWYNSGNPVVDAEKLKNVLRTFGIPAVLTDPQAGEGGEG